MTNRSPAAASALSRLAYALKLKSWPKLLVPWLFGQALGVASATRLSVSALILGLGFTVLLLAFIVLLNDYADAQVDALKRQMFPHGCSPKTIPDGVLSARTVKSLGLTAGALAALLSLYIQLSRAAGPPAPARSHVLLMGVSCLVLFLAYSLPPLRLNYRGGGECLEALGVGVLLPSFNLYLQAGQLLSVATRPFGAALGGWLFEVGLLGALVGFGLLAGASAVASGLSDEESDRLGGKRTVASTRGNASARRLTSRLARMGALSWLVTGALLLYGNARVSWPWLVAGAASLALQVPASRLSPAAVTNAFDAQARYKVALHRAIGLPAVLLSVGALLMAQLTAQLG